MPKELWKSIYKFFNQIHQPTKCGKLLHAGERTLQFQPKFCTTNLSLPNQQLKMIILSRQRHCRRKSLWPVCWFRMKHILNYATLKSTYTCLCVCTASVRAQVREIHSYTYIPHTCGSQRSKSIYWTINKSNWAPKWQKRNVNVPLEKRMGMQTLYEDKGDKHVSVVL